MTILVVEIVGEYFIGTCDVSFGYDVVVNHFVVINNKLIEATISIAPEAFASYKSIVVSTPDGSGALHKVVALLLAGTAVTLVNPLIAGKMSYFELPRLARSAFRHR